MPQHVPPLDIRRTANVILTYPPPPPPGAVPQAHHHPHHSPSPVYPPPQQPPMPTYAWPVVPPPPSQRPPQPQPQRGGPPPSADGSYVVGSPPRPSHLANPQLHYSTASVSSAPSSARPSAPGLPPAPLPGQPIAGQAFYATAAAPPLAGAAPAPKPAVANSQPPPGHYMEAYCPRCQRKMQRQMRKLQQVGVHCIPHYQYALTELEVIDLFYDMYVRRNPSESWDVNRVGCTHGGGGDARRAMSEATSTSAATSQGDFISLSHASSDSTAHTEKVAGEVSNRPDAPPPGINAGLDEQD